MQKSKHVLSKPGVSFTKKQNGLIKSLVEARKAAEAQGVVLVELNKQMKILDNPLCETVLMATEKQFGEFVERVVAIDPYTYGQICLFCERGGIDLHKKDCVWIEAKRIIAARNAAHNVRVRAETKLRTMEASQAKHENT